MTTIDRLIAECISGSKKSYKHWIEISRKRNSSLKYITAVTIIRSHTLFWIVASFHEVVSRYCCLSPSIAAATPGTAKVSYCYLRSNSAPIPRLRANGTNIHRVLVIDGYLLDRVPACVWSIHYTRKYMVFAYSFCRAVE